MESTTYQPLNSTRPHYNRELQQLVQDVTALGQKVENATRTALLLIKNPDAELAQTLIKADREINFTRYSIEQQALFLLATQQPVLGRDLRFVAGVMYIAGELERMGDYAKGIAKLSLRMEELPAQSQLEHIEKIITMSCDLLGQTLVAFETRDAGAARTIADQDSEINDYYQMAQKDLLHEMIAGKQSIEIATLMLWMLHNVERLGNRARNICNRIVYIETSETYPYSTHQHEA
jgi:phosphate transport system protein